MDQRPSSGKVEIYRQLVRGGRTKNHKLYGTHESRRLSSIYAFRSCSGRTTCCCLLCSLHAWQQLRTKYESTPPSVPRHMLNTYSYHMLHLPEIKHTLSWLDTQTHLVGRESKDRITCKAHKSRTSRGKGSTKGTGAAPSPCRTYLATAEGIVCA